MTCRVLLRLCAAWLLFGLPVRGDVIVVVPSDGTPVKVPTPLSNGPVLVFTGTWAMLPATPQGSQRILRQVYATGHEVVRGRKEWLSIDKSGTVSVKLQTVPEAAGESFTAWIACDVEEMERGASSGTLYRNARIELTVVADLRKHLGDVLLAPGDGVSVPLPPAIRVRRVSSVLEKVAAAAHEGSNLVITAKEAGSTKVTLSYWIGDEVGERFFREVEVEVRDAPPEYVCALQRGETRSVSFRDLGKALSDALPAEDGKVVRVVRWDGPELASLDLEPTALRVTARDEGRSTAVVVFQGERRDRPFQAWVRFTVDVTAR